MKPDLLSTQGEAVWYKWCHKGYTKKTKNISLILACAYVLQSLKWGTDSAQSVDCVRQNEN